MPCIEALRAMGEIQSLVAVLRRWHAQQTSIAAISGTSFFDSAPSPPTLEQKAVEKNILQLISNLCKLREKLHTCTQIEDLDALLFVSPLVEVVKNADTGATPTGVALATIQRLLQCNVISPRAPNIDHAIIVLMDSIVNYKFEPTGTGADEITIMWVMEALLQCLKCEAGRQLDDETVWKGILTVFSVAVGTQYADMLRGTALRVLADMFKKIMTTVYMSESSDDDNSLSDVHHYGKKVAHRILKFLVSKVNPAELERTSNVTVANNWRLVCLQLLNSIAEACVVPDPEGKVGHEQLAIARDEEIVKLLQDDLFLYIIQTAQVAGRGSGKLAGSGDGAAAAAGKPSTGSPNPAPGGGPASSAVAQGTMSAGDRSPHGDANLLAVCYALRLARLFVSYAEMRRELKLQVEMLFNCVFLRVLEGKSASEAQAQVVMEVLTDLMADPLLIVDLYVNYDCDVKCTDVLENLFTYLSRHAFPARLQNPALDSLQLLSLRCIIYGIHAMSERCDLPIVKYANQHLMSFTGTRESPPNLQVPKELEVVRSRKDVEFVFPDETLRHKLAKRKLLHCAREFNRKPKHGIKALREAHVLHTEPHESDAERIASFLRHTHGLDRKAIGQFLGEAGELNKAVLKAFVHTFNLSGQSLLSGLRMFLESFRLPGEAQQIDRILEMFAEVSHAECYDAAQMPTVDCAYIFSFAIIMLNTDLHNPNILPEKKMSFESFVASNKNYGEETSKGQDMPMELLESVYNEIKSREINTMTEGSEITSEITAERWRDVLSSAHAVPSRGRLITHHFLGTRSFQLEESVQRVPEPGDEAASKESKKPGEAELSNTPLLHVAAFDAQILQLVWGPAVAAMSVVFDSGNTHQQPGALKAALDGFIHCAKAAACYDLVHVFDAIAVSLCKFTTLLMYASSSEGGEEEPPHPAPKGLRSLGNIPLAIDRFNNNHKAQMATMCVFAITRRFGNHLRYGWGHVVYCLLRLCDLRLLPADLLREAEGEPSPERLAFHRLVKEVVFGAAKERVRKEKEKHEQTSGWLANWLFGGSDGPNAELLLANDPMFQHLSAALVVLEVGLQYGTTRFLAPFEEDSGENAKKELEDGEASAKREQVDEKEKTTDGLKRKKEEVNRFARDCIRSCRVHELVEESSMMNNVAVVSLLNALITASGGDPMQVPADETPSVYVLKRSELEMSEQVRAMNLEVEMLAKPSISATVFCVHLISQICIRNTNRMELLWPDVVAHLRSTLSAAKEPSFIVEKASLGLLNMCAAALRATEEQRTFDADTTPAKFALSTLQFLAELPSAVAPGLPELVGRCITAAIDEGALFESGEQIVPRAGWEYLLQYMTKTAAVKSPGLFAFNVRLCSQVVSRLAELNQVRPLELADLPPPGFVYMLSSYCRQPWRFKLNAEALCEHRVEQSVLGEMQKLHHLLLAAMEAEDQRRGSSAESQHVPAEEPSAIRDYWLPVMLEFAGVAETASLLDPDLSCQATSLLERCLLDKQGGVLSADEWRMVYDKILLPFAHNVLAVASQLHDNIREKQQQRASAPRTPAKRSGIKLKIRRTSKGANAPATLDDSAIKTQEVQLSTLELAAVGLISKVTCARCETLLDIPTAGFDSLWFNLISVFEQFKQRGVVESHGTGLLEGTTEHLKNLLLVACEVGVLKDPREQKGVEDSTARWTKTWALVEPFCPGIRSTLFPDNLEADVADEAEVKGSEVKSNPTE